MHFYPRALLVTAAGAGFLWYALGHQPGLVAIGVDVLLTGGLWAVLPARWPSASSLSASR